jgi:hypothetical protein
MRFASTRATHAALLLAASTAACTDAAAPPAPPKPAQLLVTNGDGQVAPVGTLLPGPVVVTVMDEAGRPMSGVQLVWHATGDDRLSPLDPATGADGRAGANWLLGGVAGPRRGEAIVPGLPPAVFNAIGQPDQWLPFDQPAPLDFATYEGSHEVVHPDYAATPAGAFERPFHLAITPYPHGDPHWENPSFFEGDRRDEWTLGEGAPNPVVRPDVGYLSDPDLVYVPERAELWLYYRKVADANLVLLVRTSDGRHWSAPVQVVRAPNHNLISPSVVRRAPDDWWMFSVNAGKLGCDAANTRVEVRRSTDGLQWGPPARLALERQDLWPWHIDVQWVPARQAFWAVYNAKPDGGCATGAVYLAESADGSTWTRVPQPVLVRGRIPALQDIVYRTTFEYEPESDAITFWYSGARYNGAKYVWGAVVERRRRADLYTPSTAIRATALPPAPAPLVDWP